MCANPFSALQSRLNARTCAETLILATLLLESMTTEERKAMTALLDSHITPELVNACLVLTLISVSMGIGLFAFFKRSTGRKHYGYWTVAWLLYAVYLVATFAMGKWGERLLDSIQLGCIGIGAFFLFMGSCELFDAPCSKRLVKPIVVLLAIWSFVAANWLPDVLRAKLLMFGFMAGAGMLTAYFHHRNRRDTGRINLSTLAFALWGAHMIVFPFIEESLTLRVATYFASAVFALLIAMAMIVEQAVEVSEQKFRTVFNTTGEAIFIVDLSTLEILDVNRAAQQMTRSRANQLVGRSLQELCPDLEAARANAANIADDIQKICNTVFRAFNQFRIERADGETAICEGEMSLVAWQKRSALQIKAREVAEDHKLGEHVMQHKQRAEKFASLTHLISGIAHELNNPLAVVHGYSQLLTKQNHLDEKTREHLQTILQESERASKIVRNVVSFVNPAEPQPTASDLNQIITRALEARQPELRAAAIQVTTDLSPTLPRTKADALQIEQVVSSLILNAVHAVEAMNTKRLLTLKTEECSQSLRITVSDNGMGIEPANLTKIFDPFFTTKPQGKGTGLGLTICHCIVESHLGKMWVESQPGKGARFFVELPIVHCEETAEGNAPAAADAPTADEAKHRLLVVDDEPSIAAMLKEMLSFNGYEAETAADGTEAMKKLSGGRFDLIISDLCMPNMSGPELYRNVMLRDSQLGKRMIFVTGDTVNAASRKFLESTGNRWLSKPFNMTDVEQVVSQLLRSPAAAATAVAAH